MNKNVFCKDHDHSNSIVHSIEKREEGVGLCPRYNRNKQVETKRLK